MKTCSKPIKEFTENISSQRTTAKLFIECCTLYKFCDNRLYKFDNKVKLWTESFKEIFYADYCDWIQATQLNYLNVLGKDMEQKEIKAFVDMITPKTTIKYADAVYKYSLIEITDKEFLNKLNRSHPYLIPMKNNKCYDLQTSKIIDRLQEHYFSYCFNAEYTDNKSSKVEKMINDICCGNTEEVLYLQKILSYCFSGLNEGQLIFVFNGCGANGKSLILSLLDNIMGNFYAAVDKAIMIKDNKSSNVSNALYALTNKRVGFVSETNEGEQLNEDIAKKISGGDKLSCKKLYSNLGEFDTKLTIKLILCTNNLPQFNSTQHSLVRRIRLFKFNATFCDNPKKSNEYKKDEGLLNDILKNHLNEFFSWIINGYKNVINDLSFEKDIPTSVKKSQDNYINEQNSFEGFFNDRLVLSDNKKDIIKRDMVYDNYLEYCKENDIVIKLKKKEILTMFNNKHKEPVKSDGVYIYRNIKWVWECKEENGKE